jgi:HSP20 family protein
MQETKVSFSEEVAQENTKEDFNIELDNDVLRISSGDKKEKKEQKKMEDTPERNLTTKAGGS